MTDNEKAFRVFADIYPHEAYASDPERFWRYFHAKCPTITRQEFEDMLKDTEEKEAQSSGGNMSEPTETWIATIRLPISVKSLLAIIGGLTAEHGKDLQSRQTEDSLVIFKPNARNQVTDAPRIMP